MKYSLFSHLKERLNDYTEKEIYALIMCGEIRYNGEVFRQPSQKIQRGGQIEILSARYVSRGGEKLKGLVDLWALDFKDKFILDAGSSTGGFTDCALQQGAATVFAVDVGYNQLDYRLRKNGRVIVMERCNVMSLEELNPQPHIALADLSFRSITGAAGKIISLLSDKRLYALIKPQFEIVQNEDFKGIVERPEDWKKVLLAVLLQLHQETLGILRATASKVKGRKGNQEFFFEIAPEHHCLGHEEQRDLILQLPQFKGLERIS
jgi:23S rRNA (cytidine1920-2'-O)/16S rRNA (cytidine1409-2'-O)-methyltransferase